ncbi:MAG: hypothetical protein JW702_03095 [Clostridiales bacterium]|nr:hypothetical protein [Clostridiales bacterium]
MINNQSRGLHFFDRLIPEKPSCQVLDDGITFRKMPYRYSDAEGENLVNIYAIEIENFSKYKFGINFSCRGNYCVRLAQEANEKTNNSLLCAMNCNFGIISDEYDIEPVDITYNLHLEDSRLFQWPVADKTTLLVNHNGLLDISFRRAFGTLRINHELFQWIGSLTKETSKLNSTELLYVYNSFNRGILILNDPITGTRKLFDPERTYTPFDNRRIDLIINYTSGKLRVSRINTATKTHFFEGILIISIPNKYANQIKPGDVIEDVTIDGTHLNDYVYGATVGAIITPNKRQTELNILRSQVIQTRYVNGIPSYQTDYKACRACIIQTVNKTIFFLADARNNIEGQKGLTIADLQDILLTLYPNLVRFVNVDGGHAAKIVLNTPQGFDVYGNLHYKTWPENSSEKFKWNGYLGRKVPAIIYAYKEGQ